MWKAALGSEAQVHVSDTAASKVLKAVWQLVLHMNQPKNGIANKCLVGVVGMTYLRGGREMCSPFHSAVTSGFQNAYICQKKKKKRQRK